ncbi:MAG: hypothetical protein R3C11_22090 [Planctomycetaceae bacterium]
MRLESKLKENEAHYSAIELVEKFKNYNYMESMKLPPDFQGIPEQPEGLLIDLQAGPTGWLRNSYQLGSDPRRIQSGQSD